MKASVGVGDEQSDTFRCPEEFDHLILETWMNWMCQDGVTALELLFQHRVDSSGLNGGIDFEKARS